MAISPSDGKTIAFRVLLSFLFLTLQQSFAGQYSQNFQSSSEGATNLTDGSQFLTTVPGVLPRVAGSPYRELRLAAPDVEGVRSVWLLPDLDPGTAAYAFSAKWSMEVNGSFPHGGEGFSFNFGDLSGIDFMPFQGPEEGFDRGLTISFRNGVILLDRTVFGISVNGTNVNQSFHSSTGLWGTTNTARRFFEVDYHFIHGVTVRIDGVTFCENLAVSGFTPKSGDRFALAVGCLYAPMSIQVDNMTIVTRGNFARVSTTSPYYASGELSPTHTADKAFDNDRATKWLVPTATGYIGASVQTEPRTVFAYTVTSGDDLPGRDPGGWHFESTTNAGTNWSRHATVSPTRFVGRKETHSYFVPNPTPANAFRLLVPVNSSDPSLQLAEICFYEKQNFDTNLASATTQPATEVTTNTAMLNGSVNPEGFTTTAQFLWGTTATNLGNSTTPQALGNGNTVVPVSALLTNLLPGAPYYFQLIANIPNPIHGTVQSFITPSLPASALTMPVFLRTSSNALLQGKIIPGGMTRTKAWFQWGTTTNYGQVIPAQVVSGLTEMLFNFTVDGLSPMATYHCQLVVSNELGISYGGNISFSTPPAVIVPWTQTSAPTNYWRSIALNADGSRLLAGCIRFGILPGGLFISTNSGAGWNEVESLNTLGWYSVASSGSGTRLFALARQQNDSQLSAIAVSTNGGVNWKLYHEEIITASADDWTGVSSSADGQVIAVSATRFNSFEWSPVWFSRDRFYTNENNEVFLTSSIGETLRASPGSRSNQWNAVALTADGSRALSGGINLPLYLASETNPIVPLNVPTGNYRYVSISADASTMAAIKDNSFAPDELYLSSDAGTTWRTIEFPDGRFLRSVVMSADGRRIALAGGNSDNFTGDADDRIFMSNDGGATWEPIMTGISGAAWNLAMSADGNTLAAAGNLRIFGGIQPQQWHIYLWKNPVLKQQRIGAQLALTWTTNQTGLVLQSTTNLVAPNWQIETNGISVLNGDYRLLVSPTSASKFFRLGSNP